MTVRQFSIRALLLGGVALIASAAPSFAQEASLAPAATAPAAVVAPAPVRNDSTVAVAGPTRESAAVGFHVAGELNRTPAPARGSFSQGETLMIVGGAAILTGIVVGGDAGHAISIGGAVVGLIGLYQYLQ